MLINPSVRPLREHDSDGRLVAAGAEWAELRLWAIWLIAPLYIAPYFVFALALIFGLANGFPLPSVIAMLVGLLGMILSIRLANYVGQRRRSLLIRADGSVVAPQGLHFVPRFVLKDSSIIDQALIVSIEAERDTRGEPFVCLYSSEGDRFTVGFRCPAHKLAVQLQKALRDIRRGYADEHGERLDDFADQFAYAAAHARSGDTIRVAID